MMLVSLCADTIKPVFEGGQNLTAVEGNASVYQENPVSRITGEGRAEFLKTWRPGFDQEGAGRGGGATQSVRGNYKSFNGDKSDGFGKNAPVIMDILALLHRRGVHELKLVCITPWTCSSDSAPLCAPRAGRRLHSWARCTQCYRSYDYELPH